MAITAVRGKSPCVYSFSLSRFCDHFHIPPPVDESTVFLTDTAAMYGLCHPVGCAPNLS